MFKCSNGLGAGTVVEFAFTQRNSLILDLCCIRINNILDSEEAYLQNDFYHMANIRGLPVCVCVHVSGMNVCSLQSRAAVTLKTSLSIASHFSINNKCYLYSTLT